MFGFLKKKLEEAIGSFTKKAEKEAEIVEEPKEEQNKTVQETPQELKEAKEKRNLHC